MAQRVPTVCLSVCVLVSLGKAEILMLLCCKLSAETMSLAGGWLRSPIGENNQG